MKSSLAALLSALVCSVAAAATPTQLRCEYLESPRGIDATSPRLSWRIESNERSVVQTGYQILVASSAEKLHSGDADLWDSGRVQSRQTTFIAYQGPPLTSRQQCHWKVATWATDADEPVWSESAMWSMGLLAESDWSADYISNEDTSAIHTDTSELFLPPARQYRREFSTTQSRITRATIHATALGIYELHLNGQKVSDDMFAPGWTDYRQRAYVNTYDVTKMIRGGDNAIGAWVADGWYSGYVGFGLLTGMGTERNGRSTYGKTPAVMAQLEIEYDDGSRQTIGTDATWRVTADGPIREADLLMGEVYDARREMSGWSSPGFDDSDWQPAILASNAEPVTAMFFEARNPAGDGGNPKITGQPRDLGFHRPKLESFPGVPVRVTEEIPTQTVTPREPGTFMFDLGQNFAGTIRLQLTGPAGHAVTIRHGEMLHPDGRLMTENLRKARATDTYICKGDPDGEIYEPRFTFHGFQFVEVQNFPGIPTADSVTGLVVHSDTPMVSSFACDDPMVNRLFQNVLWTQRSNFLDLPTDCPQRDERMGWTGDAQAYVATAAYNADIGAFYTKWLRELMQSQRPSGAFPGYAPFPFQHGWDFGTAWADAGVICPWTIWQFYGDTRVIDDCWEPMTRFMDWRQRTSVNDLGIVHGNAWGDWLTQGAATPLDYIDTIYYAISTRMMMQMAAATGRDAEATRYAALLDRISVAFNNKYVNPDGSVNINTQTAQAMALDADLIPHELRPATGEHLAAMLAENGNHMSTGFLGTRPLLPVLSASGQHDLATFLLQSREFPSWGYEIANGATTIWERWDSYTKEDAFGRHNAAMNSFSHYAFGAVCEWMFATLAGIQSDAPGFSKILIAPQIPSPGSNAQHPAIGSVTASYDCIHGTILSDWKIDGDDFHLRVTIPTNTTAAVHLPTEDASSITENGQALSANPHVTIASQSGSVVVLDVGSGRYDFRCRSAIRPAETPLTTSVPPDRSVNPDNLDLAGSTVVASWDFSSDTDARDWTMHHLEFILRDGSAFLRATGDDPQMIAKLAEPLTGSLVVAIRLAPLTSATTELFWAGQGQGFSPQRFSTRKLTKGDATNEYLFAIPNGPPLKSLRLDPFKTFDPYADRGELRIESISIRRVGQ